MIKSISGAKKYAQNIKKELIKEPLAKRDWADAIKFLAEAKDEENFKAIVDYMSREIKSKKNITTFI